MSMPESFLVIVKCMTFNHHAYIEDAMNGFCMQKTDFPFVCVIVDDASTDGEPEVIKKYFDVHFDLSESGETDDYVMTFGRHKKNENCYFAVLYLKYNHYSIKKDKLPYYVRWQDSSKYIALCEGDDYWIDSTKLQRQADIMENDFDTVMIFSDYETVSANKEKKIRKKYEFLKHLAKHDTLESLLLTNYILTCTILCRPEVYKTDFYINCPKKYDYTLFFSAAFLGKVVYISDKLASYRQQDNSLTNSTLTRKKVEQDIYEIHKYACMKYLDTFRNKMSFVSKCKCKYNMMIFSIHIWRINYDRTFVCKLFKKDYSLVVFFFIAMCKKIGETTLRFLGLNKNHYSED